MKTFSKIFAYAAVAAFALSSCTSEKLKNDNLNEGKTVTVHFGAETTDPSSKATLTPNDGETAFQAAWENGDEILISYSFNNQPPTTTTGTWNLDSKSFEAELLGDNGAWVYDAAYPVPAKDNSVDFGTNRTQKGNAYNSKYDIMIGKASATNAEAGKDHSGNNIIFKMDRQTAIAYFHFTSNNKESITKAKLKVEGKGAAIAAQTLLLDPTGMDYEAGLSEIELTTTGQTADDFTLWFNVLPTSYTSMTLTVETATKTFTISKSSVGEYVAGKLYKVKKDNIAWTNKAVTPSVSVVNVDNVNAVKEMGNGSYGDYKDNAQTITVDGLEYSMENICANSKNGNDGYTMAAKQFIQMKANTSYILNTKSGVTNVKAWVLPKTTGAISVYQGTTSEKISTLINDPNKTTETVKLISNLDNEVDTQLDVYEYTITDGFFKLAPSAALWLYKLEVTYSNGGSSEGGSDPEKLAPPSVRCTAKTETSLTFSWNEDAHANGYQVSTDGGETYSSTQAVTTYTWTGLEASTSYTLYVKAIGDGTNYTNSDAASASGTTTAGSGSGDHSHSISQTPVYTLSFAKNEQATSYTANHSTTSNGIEWDVYGNQSVGDNLRVGGKNTTATDRSLTSKAVISSTKKIGKISINHSGTGNGRDSSITVNSIKVEGSVNSDFTSSKVVIINNPSVSSAGTLDFSLDGADFDSNSYFKITINYRISGSNNCYLTINSVKFFSCSAN